jgi:hypothetical protein
MQSIAALARVLGPPMGGLSYELVGMRGPYILGAIGLLGVLIVSARLVPLRPKAATTTA